MTRNGLLTASVGMAALLCAAATASAQVAPPLGASARFGVLGNSGVTGSSSAGTLVSGDVGSSPTATIVSFPPSRVPPPFVVHSTNDGVVQQAHTDAIAAYNALATQGSGTVLPDNLATVGALTSGIYSFVSGAPNLPASATLTLNGGGIFIFNVGSTLTANVLSNIVGTADPCNIYWRVGTSATINGDTFKGTVVADATITVGDGASVAGRLLAGTGATGAVTMAGAGGNTIGGCSTPPPVCPLITINPPTLPNGAVGVAYSQTLTASGGTGAHTFSVVSGTLPAGLTLTAGGVLSGTPTTAASATVTIRATDDNGCTAEITYTLLIASSPLCPTITLLPPTLPNASVGAAYTRTITATGGTAPYIFTVTSGVLPAGITLTPAGVLAGTPTTAGSRTFTIRGTDANGCFAEITYTMIVSAGPVCPVITLAPATLPNGAVGVAYSQAITASGGTAPYAFTIVAGALPSGLTLSAAGVVSGTPLTASTSTFTIRGTDANGCFAEVAYTMAITAAVPTLPQAFAMLLALTLVGTGYLQLRRRSQSEQRTRH